MTEGTPAPAPAPTPAPTPAPEQWYAGSDAETTGYLQNRGWDKLPAKDAALAAVKSYREAEKHIGAPPDQILRMPKDAADKEGWAKVHARLGVPADAKEYDFTGVKFTDGTELNPDVANTIRTMAHENHLPKDTAAAVAKAVVKMMETAEEGETASYNQKLELEKGTLRTNWGSNAPAYKVIAENAAKALGVTSEELAALEKVAGYAKVMDMFRNIGSRIGEDKFIASGGGSGGNLITKEQAVAQLASLERDEAWMNKFMAGDAAALQQFDNLTKIKSGYVG